MIRSRPRHSSEGDVGESSLQEFLDVGQTVKENYLISGALPNDNVCRENPQRPACLTDSCSGHQRKTVNNQRKPLPRPPDLILRPVADSAQLSLFSPSPNIRAFRKEVDTRFLTALEQQVLQSIQRLSEPPTSPANILVQLGVDAFWMSRRDAGMLERIDALTENLNKGAKETLLKDLDPLLKPPYRYPLKQVLLHGAQVIWRKPEADRAGDNESLIDLYSDIDDSDSQIDESREDLMPAPLRIRRPGQGGFYGPHRPHRLSRLSELSEPNAPIGPGKPRAQLEEVQEDDDGSKQPGSVSRARACLLKSQGEVLDQSNVINEAQPSQNSPQKLFLAASSAQVESKQPGSVRNARENLFTNPREAPKPPVSLVRPYPRESSVKLPKQPGSVSRARIAAQNALSQGDTKISNNQATKVHEPFLDAPKQSGSVRRARENLNHKPKDDQAFPERLSSLPLPPIEERRRNCKFILHATTAHPHKALSSRLDFISSQRQSKNYMLIRSQ